MPVKFIAGFSGFHFSTVVPLLNDSRSWGSCAVFVLIEFSPSGEPDALIFKKRNLSFVAFYYRLRAQGPSAVNALIKSVDSSRVFFDSFYKVMDVYFVSLIIA